MSGKKGMKIRKKRIISEETRKKISETVKKRWQEKEYREKVSAAHKHELPDEWKRNIAKGMTGIKRSEETKKKMSESQSKRSEESRKRQSISWKKQWNSLSKEEQMLRLEKWINAGHNAQKDGSYLKPSSIELKVKE